MPTYSFLSIYSIIFSLVYNGLLLNGNHAPLLAELNKLNNVRYAVLPLTEHCLVSSKHKLPMLTAIQLNNQLPLKIVIYRSVQENRR